MTNSVALFVLFLVLAALGVNWYLDAGYDLLAAKHFVDFLDWVKFWR